MQPFIKTPCKHCPYRRDVKPFLTPERGEELAYLPQNPYNEFHCHKTIEYDGDEDHQGRPTEDFSKIQMCAGFLTLRAQDGLDIPDGFEPAWEMCYTDSYEMADAYERQYETDTEHYEKENKK